MTTFQLRNADITMKLLITAFLFVLTTGYVVGILFVQHATSLRVQGVQEQFLGNNAAENAREIKYAKGTNEMFVFIHTHVLSLSLTFFMVGSIFYFSSMVTSTTKRLLLLEPFAAILTTFGGIALVRYVSPVWSWMVYVSGFSLLICYLTMVMFIFKEVWFLRQSRSHLQSTQ